MGSASEEVHWSPPLDAVTCVANASDSSAPGAACSEPSPERIAAERASWTQLRAWLRTSAADSLVDDAVLGCLPAWAADELLEEYRIVPTRATRRHLAILIDHAAVTP